MERRRPNIHTMRHIAAAHLSESFAGQHIVDGVPPSAGAGNVDWEAAEGGTFRISALTKKRVRRRRPSGARQ
ncbi:MAG: hypothetical protein Q7T68_05755 [Sphingopyxis sp.]|nr:hypothetical protein [Sphingopyxis sp.]